VKLGSDKSNTVAELVVHANHELGVPIISYCVVRHTRPLKKRKARRIQSVNKVWATPVERAGIAWTSSIFVWPKAMTESAHVADESVVNTSRVAGPKNQKTTNEYYEP
jgi:hypothetical protein